MHEASGAITLFNAGDAPFVRRHAIALYFVFYNFCRIHQSLKVSPAVVAGISETLWSLEDVFAKIDEMAPASKVRGPYKKRA